MKTILATALLGFLFFTGSSYACGGNNPKCEHPGSSKACSKHSCTMQKGSHCDSAKMSSKMCAGHDKHCTDNAKMSCGHEMMGTKTNSTKHSCCAASKMKASRGHSANTLKKAVADKE